MDSLHRLPETSISDSHVPVPDKNAHANMNKAQKAIFEQLFQKCEKPCFDGFYKIIWIEKPQKCDQNLIIFEHILRDIGYSNLKFLPSSKDLRDELASTYVKDNVVVISSEKLAFNTIQLCLE